MSSADPTVGAASGPGTASASAPIAWGRVVAVGLVAGLTSGLFGVGGGIIIVPALMAVAHFAPKLATGTSLTAIVPISISGAIGYTMADEIDWGAAGLIALGALAGALAGTSVLRRIEPTTLQKLFAVALLVTAARMVFEEGDGSRGSASLTVGGIAALLLLGLASGVLAGLLGVGGGIVMVPALVLLLALPQPVAKGTSLVVIIPTALVATLRNMRAGDADVGLAASAGLTGVLFGFAASLLSLRLDPVLSAVLFGALLMAMAIRLLLSARGKPLPGDRPTEARTR
jgi:uncharacterized membrane protein YfcA